MIIFPLTRRSRPGFTILEVLMALVASLLLMLGLTRAFKLMGDAISSSQSELAMANSLRDVTFRLRDELMRMTPSMSAPQDYGSETGYFTYYEGPWTDATATIVSGRVAAPGAENYFPTSRYGDLDDYLAFTTRSEPGRPFVGIVPRGVIEAVRLAEHFSRTGGTGGFVTLDSVPLGGFTPAQASSPIAIYSEVAEVAYFLSPGWRRNELGVPYGAIPGSTDQPQFIDQINETGGLSVGDNIPDQLSLIRRLLLVRSDLNLTVLDIARIRQGNPALAATDLPAADQPYASTPVIPYLNGNAIVRLSDIPAFSPGAWSGSPLAASPSWLTGLARPLQWMDLSISRVNSPGDGTPSQQLKANSLRDLAIPDNRFGFVRIPSGVVGGLSTEFTSSMPLLALSGPHPFIAQSQSDTVAIDPQTLASQTGGQVVGAANAFSMVGFMRPEFSLADHSVPLGGSLAAAAPTFRGGSDVVATDVLSFDIQLYDPEAPVATWRGRDGEFGNAAIDGGEADNAAIETTDPGFRHVLQNFSSGDYRVESRGGFVDHGYARIAGGAVGGFNASRIPGGIQTLFASRYSGRVRAGGGRFPDGWIKSGRVIAFNGLNGSFFQPAIDTWSDYYDHDGFVQQLALRPDLSFAGSPDATGVQFRGWTSDSDSRTGVSFVTGQNANRQATPPSENMPTAIKITIRIYDRNAGEVRQQTIIEHFTSQ